MNQLSCQESCPSPCSALATEQPSLPLAEVLVRFSQQAAQGVCDTGRYRMPYFVGGAGRPLVFVHGIAATSRSFLAPIARLSAHFRCIGYDLPGRPGDGARLWRYRHDDLVADLWALLDHLKIERAYLLGSSFGATVALRAMRQRPERLPRGIVQGGLAYRPLRTAERFFAWLFRRLPGPT